MTKEQIRIFLNGQLPFFKKLPQPEAEAVLSSASGAFYRRGSMLLSREKECNGLVLVKSGQLRAYFESEDGKEITLYRLLSGDICILSASCVLRNITFEVTLEAEKDSEVVLIPASVWGKLSEQNPEAGLFTQALINERFSEVMWVMEQIVSKNMGQRLAAFLLEQSALDDTRILSMTHETIAKNLGTAREVISRMLKYFENDRIVSLSRGKIQLEDLNRLKEMSL
ncbi:MAG TPA: Crp/Fnr family transcriptional regulator [Clostridia bacterium]|nr:Crp/Fnr family transcriptional regulator [Clostridia bacterium]